MIFDYTPITSSISRPLIFTRISFKDKYLLTKALVDSGSDYCIFPIDYAHSLKIPIFKTRKTIFSVFSGEKATLHLYQVNLTIVDLSCKAVVGFTDAIGEFSYGVLGQKGFFDHFKVCFDKSKGQIEITPK